MPKAPAVTADQLGAVVDGLATTNAMLFMLLASHGQSDAALRLLDRMAEMPVSEDPLNWFRSHVAEVTATTIRQLREGDEAPVPLGLPAMR